MNEQKQRVMKWIDEHEENIVEFLRDMVKIPSVNPGFEEGRKRE